jgi:hypothetical protein
MDNQSFMGVIKEALKESEKVFWKAHALMRMRQRGIRVDDIEEALFSGEVIEEYRSDKPFPSVLVNGRTLKGRPIHVVVGVNVEEQEIHIVTGYEPDPNRWDSNFGLRMHS